MEKVLNSEMSKFLLLGFLVIGLFTMLTATIGKIWGSFKAFQKSTILYVLCWLLFFAIVAIPLYFDLLISPFHLYIFFQATFLVFGIVHFHLMHRYLPWSGTEKSIWVELLFTVIIALLGGIVFMLVYRYIKKDGLHPIMATSICFFVIPFFICHLFTKALTIPPKIIRQWLYPINEEKDEPDESKMKNLVVISFEFQKQLGDKHLTNFRAKAPIDMIFGELFYYFINDYNERHVNSTIQFSNAAGVPHGWIFYKKPGWYSFKTQYIRADQTIFINNIKENDVIVCSRS